MSSTNLRPAPTTAVDDAASDQQVRSFLEGRPFIKSHIRALTRERALAYDVFQEVWLRLGKATRHGQIILNVTAWCRATARLVALDAWREHSRHRSVPDKELSALIDKAYKQQDSGGGGWKEHIDAELGQSLGSTKPALCWMCAALLACAHNRLLQLPSSLWAQIVSKYFCLPRRISKSRMSW